MKSGSQIVSADVDQNQCCICFRTYKKDVQEETVLSVYNVYVRDMFTKTILLKLSWTKVEENPFVCTAYHKK